jgi:RNA polymerase sigma-70 factor (ECF subfamily)
MYRMGALADSAEVGDHGAANTEQVSLCDLYLAHRANLVRFFAARTRSMAEAEDLVQELYLKLLGLNPSIDVKNPSALLYRMGSNLLQDRMRGERRARLRDFAWRESAQVALGGEDVADEPAADEVVASKERLRQLTEAVATLPPQMRRAFRLHKLEGLSHVETARAMGISTSAVEKHISAALRMLLKRFG